MDKFQNKYRISSLRYWGWDYPGAGTYFITLIIRDHKCLLGEISNQKMEISNFGKIISEQWIRSFEIRNELFLDEFVIMPNHLHGLVVLKNIEDFSNVQVESNGRSTLHPAKPDQIYYRQNKPQLPKFKSNPKSISSFVAGFKSATINKIDDHIDLTRKIHCNFSPVGKRIAKY